MWAELPGIRAQLGDGSLTGQWVLVLLGVVVCAVIAAVSLRFVTRGERMVVMRLGRVAGLHGPGVVVLLPLVDRGIRVNVQPSILDLLWVTSVSRDDVAVTVNAAVTVRVRDCLAWVLHPESSTYRLQEVAEVRVRRYVGQRPLADLLRSTSHDRRDLVEEISTGLRPYGVEALTVELTRVDVRLEEDLIAWAQRYGATLRPRPEPSTSTKGETGEGTRHRGVDSDRDRR